MTYPRGVLVTGRIGRRIEPLHNGPANVEYVACEPLGHWNLYNTVVVNVCKTNGDME